MKQVAGIVGGAAVAIMLGSALASAQQVMWKDNPISGKVVGLTYGTSGWNAAEAQAVAYGGHLVTVRSQAEHQWLVDQFASSWTANGSGPWIGLRDVAVEGVWTWVSGEAVSPFFFSWGPGQPDNSQGAEDWVHYLGVLGSGWNDLPEGEPLRGLIEASQRPSRSWSWPTAYATGPRAHYGCTFDMDNDGDLDFAIPVTESGRVDIWRNDGSGNFGATPAISKSGFNWVSRSLPVDWDGDGDLDLLVVDMSSFMPTASGRLLLMANGGATWQLDVLSNAIPIAYGLTVGDINSDERVDVVTTSPWYDDRTRVFLRQLDGSLSAPVVYGPYSDDAYQPTLADLDLDGALDLVIAGGGVRILRGSGSGSFVDGGNIGAGRSFRCIAADLNGDGYPEILASRIDNDVVEVWRTTSTGPLAVSNYSLIQSLPCGDGPLWIETGDVDGDGDLDVVVPSHLSDTVHILRNTTTGLVQDHVLAGQDYACYNAVDDLNGDAKPDILTSNYNANGFSVHLNQSIFDCNANGIDDPLDIASGASTDCNANGRPDSCELSAQTDCDGNGTLDACQPLSSANDCNTNGQLDVCETAAGTAPDCNLNSRPDSCDLAAGAPDCNLNHTPDSCDLGTGTSQDADFDGVPDECSTDCNGNGLKDAQECLQGLVADCNVNQVPDSCEAGGSVLDCNANGVPDSCDVAAGGDCNGNNVPDACDLAAGAPDCNANQRLDSCDLAAGAADCDGNLVPDVCQPVDASNDCNANMVLDVCDILAGAPDCNANGRPDSCDADTNNDGVPDECQDGGTPFCFGDGTANSTPCPCGGVGASRSGCPNSANAAGGYLVATGLPSRIADTLMLRASQMPPVATMLYFQGTSQATTAGGTVGTVFGDGLRCAAGAVVRLGFRTNSGGASEIPSGGSPALHLAGQIPASGAVTRYYQGWYRDVNPTFCTTNRYNLTNGVAVVWVP